MLVFTTIYRQSKQTFWIYADYILSKFWVWNWFLVSFSKNFVETFLLDSLVIWRSTLCWPWETHEMLNEIEITWGNIHNGIFWFFMSVLVSCL